MYLDPWFQQLSAIHFQLDSVIVLHFNLFQWSVWIANAPEQLIPRPEDVIHVVKHWCNVEECFFHVCFKILSVKLFVVPDCNDWGRQSFSF